MQIDPVFTGIPIGTGVTMLSFFGWNRRTRRAVEAEIGQRDKALKGQVRLRPVDVMLARSQGYGQLPLAIFGSKGASTVPAMLMNFERMGADSYVGPILLAELARDLRDMCIAAIPEVFHDRIFEVEAHMLPAGLGGMTIAEVHAIEKYWFREIRLATERWLEAIDRNTAITGVGPVAAGTELSSAGHAALAYYPIKMFVNRFPLAPVYAATIFDTFTGVRKRYPDISALFDPEELVRGYMATDNQLNQSRNDFGGAHLWPAMMVGSWLTREHVGALNGLGRVFPKEDPGRTATISVWAESLPTFYIEPWKGKLPGVFYTSPQVVQEKIIRGIETVVQDESLMGLPFRKSAKGNARVLNIVAPVVPDDFAEDIVAIQDRVGPWLKELDVDMAVQYVSTTQPLTPGGTGVITLVLLQGVDAGPDELKQLAEGAYPIPHGFLSDGNGHKPSPERKQLEQKASRKNGKKADKE